MHRRCLLPCALMLLAGASPEGRAVELSSACRPVFVAMEKTVQSNHAITTTSTHGGDATRGVTVDGTAWLQVRGAWRKSPLTVQAMIDMSRENLKDAKEYSCKSLPDSVVDGTPVSNYATHDVSGDDDVIDSRVAIAKATGLAVSVENRIGGDASATTTTHYTYGNVKAPM